MAVTITKGYTFGSTELVTSAKLHSLVDSSTWAVGSQAAGDIIYYTTEWVRLPKGSDGQVLTLADGLPTWATP